MAFYYATEKSLDEMQVIDAFTGDYRFLSNFSPIWPAGITYEGIRYRTVEHAYQAAKSLDMTVRKDFAMLRSPSRAKHYGRLIPLRDDWEAVRIPVMRALLKLKFDSWGPPINSVTREAELLMATAPAILIEGNHWGDTFWGVCEGDGANWLGHLLMARRAELLSIVAGEAQLPPESHKLMEPGASPGSATTFFDGTR
jgi:ribA/ribD-fused uncharacterized protein